MRRKKKFTSALSFVLSLLVAVSCIQPVMAAQAVPDVESVSGEAAAQAEGNEDTNVSVSAAPAKEETSEAPAESTENTPTEETAPAETTESTQEEVVSEPAAEEPQPTKVLSFENTKDKLSVELTKESDFDPGSTADIHLLKDNAYKDLVENLKKSLEAKNKGYTVGLDTLLAAEVNVLDDDGNKKDAGKVSAKIFTDASVLKDSVLYHQKEDQTWEEIQFETAEDASYVTFDAEKLGNFVFAKADLAKKEELETSFSYKDKTVTITAKATEEAGLKKGTKLCAVALEKGSKEYKDAVKKVEKSVGLKKGQTLHFKPYDVYFEYKGEKIEPQDGTVKIAMTFKEKIFQDVTESTPVERSFVAHIKDNGEVEQLTDTSAKEKKVAFDVESFSVMGPALLSTDPEISPLADTDAYAILYESGEMVFQRGSTPDASKGTVLKTYTGFETERYTLSLSSSYAPWYENKDSIKTVSFKDIIKPVSTACWFYGCRNLTNVDITNLDTSAVTDMACMFSWCISLKSLDVSSFDTKSVTSMGRMFENCSSLKSLDLSSFDTSAVTNMALMFNYSNALETLTLGTKFAFKGNADLVDATWHGINTNKEYTTSVLTSTYDGPTMADTYIKCFDIKFDAMGGKSSESKKTGYVGMAFDSLPTAEKRGYDFVGWFTEKQGGTQLLVNQPITQSTYYAQYTEHKYTITVTNDVTGTMGDKTKDFTFQLKMKGNIPAELHYTKGTETGTLKVTDGVAEFTLSHGENIVLSEIPIGTAYEITEVDGASNGYTVESTNSSGTLTEDTNVSFTNTRNGTIPTSAHTNILISIGLFAIALAGLFWHLRKRKQ